MSKSSPVRLLAGVATLLPWAYMLYFFNQMSPLPSPQSISTEEFHRFFRIHLMVTFIIFAILAGFIIYLFRTDRVPQSKKALWAVVLFMGNMVSMPVFWYLYVRPAQWQDPKADL